MIEQIFEFTKFLLNQNENIQTASTEGKIIFINANPEEKEVFVSVEDYINENKNLYIQGDSKGNKPALFAPLTEPQKTTEKIKKFIEKISNESKKMKKETIDFQQILQQLDEKLIDKIKEELKQIKSNKIFKDQKIFLGIKIYHDGKYKYPGEIEIIRNISKKIEEDKLKENLNKSICSFCKEEKENISDQTNNVFKFYTVDKPGFIAGSQINNFQKEKSWKNYPVCLDCYEILKKSKEILKNKLSFSMEGIKYYLIPSIIFTKKEAYEEIQTIMELRNKKQELKEAERITNEQDEILFLLKDKNFLYFYLLFYEEDNSAERILLLVEDIPPSNFKKIFESKHKTETIIEKYAFKNYDYHYYLSKLKKFFITKQGSLTIESKKFFLDYLESIFKLKKINKNLLIKHFILNLQNSVQKLNDRPYDFDTLVFDSISNFLFFINLGLIDLDNLFSYKEESEFKEEVGGDYMLDKIYSDLKLDNEDKQGLFILGILTRLLLEEQRKRLNNTPFFNKLKSLRMTKKDFMDLLPQIINKFQEYDYYSKIQEILYPEASEKLLKSKWEMSNEEMNFYFATGMSLYRKVKDIIYGGDNND